MYIFNVNNIKNTSTKYVYRLRAMDIEEITCFPLQRTLTMYFPPFSYVIIKLYLMIF